MSKWIEVMFDNEEIGEVTKDGLLYRFKPEQIEDLLKNYLKDEIGWFFNETKDRYCAEKEGSYIMINPSVVVDLLGYPAIFGI